MTRSSSLEPPKVTKRKGARSVSTLTPTQLARKRANDREAQRAIRARTKEHIEKLERELNDLRRQLASNKTVKELMDKNKMLEEELRYFREKSVQYRQPAAHYPSPIYEDNMTAPVSDPLGSFISAPETSAAWTTVQHCSIPAPVSSPSPASTNNDEFAYMGAGMPALPDTARLPPTSMPVIKTDLDYDGMEGDHRYPRTHEPVTLAGPYVQHQQPQQQPPQQQPQQQHWNLYGVYYPHSPSL